ncbi:MAG: hypothetical protein HOL51_11435 [Gemmatimonadetes bacterium]|jgi:hypothetical protein|nr:hypothetical protein [Gemmatimonadota bacterium]MBT5326724.1 hypothetical protein [Gemmatimonadota bacterium]MBT5452803.1 hypothetical protein [Gemmatimonadota bacterium]MBT5801214.1 hypothetical protein [Gemmatimonadota bacterium]MBT6623628.1 hypothetical protein [Gemmatimonadota bacterium]
MRIIAIGCEYSGVTTLLQGLNVWGAQRGVHFHMDDHFTIPDAYHLSDEEQQAMLDMLPAIKERFQRFQIVYHVRLINNYQHILFGGFHLEEEVYGPLYYYPGLTVSDTRKYESEMPDDAILVHLHARPEVIAQRLDEAPHPHTIIKPDDVPMLLDRFAEEYRTSWIRHKVSIDTSDLTPQQLLDAFFKESNAHFNTRDALLLLDQKYARNA